MYVCVFVCLFWCISWLSDCLIEIHTIFLRFQIWVNYLLLITFKKNPIGGGDVCKLN